MVTYPSTHGVFEAGHHAKSATSCTRTAARCTSTARTSNALVGLAAPGEFGADVSHLNLHKTFCIPHGGGGPGVGPVAVGAHLARFLPGHRCCRVSVDAGARAYRPGVGGAVRQRRHPADFVDVHRDDGRRRPESRDRVGDPRGELHRAARLAPHYPVLYSGPRRTGRARMHPRPAAAEGRRARSRVDDVAKRLMDYGFHAPTMSFPVAGTLMIEPTESESKAELDRFVDAMIAIREEIRAIEEGRMDRDDNPLKNAPHTAASVARPATGTHRYSREQAAYPLAGAESEQVLAAGRPRRQRLRRPQSVLLLRAGRGLRVVWPGEGSRPRRRRHRHDDRLVSARARPRGHRRRHGRAPPALETSFANGGQISVSHVEPWANPGGAAARSSGGSARPDAPLLFRPRLDLAAVALGPAVPDRMPALAHAAQHAADPRDQQIFGRSAARAARRDRARLRRSAARHPADLHRPRGLRRRGGGGASWCGNTALRAK